MTRYLYRPVKQYLRRPDLGDYVSYGIHAFSFTPSGCTEAALLFDVSPDFDLVSDLARRCTRLGLAPIHLPDVAIDAIS